jgi:hypothetical protein
MNKKDHVLVSSSDLNKLIEFQKTLDTAFNEMHALFIVVAEKSDGLAKSLAYLGATHASNWQDYCIEDESVARLEIALDDLFKENNNHG